jgi:nucleosome binding factor SPN SPT16 subunit
MSSLAQETLMGSSSVETEIIAATAAVDIAIDEGQQRDDDLYDYNRELERERHERRMARLALRNHQGIFSLSITNGRNVYRGHHDRNFCRRPALRRQY